MSAPISVIACGTQSSDDNEDESTSDKILKIETFDKFDTEDMKYASSQTVNVAVSNEYGTLNVNRYLPFEPSYINVNKSNELKRIVYKNEDSTVFAINDFEKARVSHAKAIVKLINNSEKVDDTTRRMNLNNLDIGNVILKNNFEDTTELMPLKELIKAETWYEKEKANIENQYIFAKLGINSADVFNVWKAIVDKNYKTRDGYNHGNDVKAKKLVKTWANVEYDIIKNVLFTYFDPKLYPEITSTFAYFQDVNKLGDWLGENNVTTDATDKSTNYLILSDEEDGIRSGYTRTLNSKTQFAKDIDDFEEIVDYNDVQTKFTPNQRYYINSIDDEILSGSGATANKAPGWVYKLKSGADGLSFGYFERDSSLNVKEYMSIKSISYEVSWKRKNYDAEVTKHYFGVTTNKEPADNTTGRRNDAKAKDKIVGAFSSISDAKPELTFSSVNTGIMENSGEFINDFLWFRKWNIPTSDAVFDADDTDKEFLYFFVDGKLVVSKRTVNPN